MLDLPAPLDRRKVVWSHTFLHTYAGVCPYQAYRKFIKRDIPYVGSAAADHGLAVHKAMQRRVEGKPLPDEYAQFEPFAAPFDGMGIKPELKLGITIEGKPTDFFGPDVWGSGVIDVPIINGTKAYIGDWKTGKSKYESPFELQIHAVLLQAKYPELQSIKGQYIYLGENHSSQLYDLSDTLKTWNKILGIMREVSADQVAGHFEKRQNPLCGYCPVKDCEYNRSTK